MINGVAVHVIIEWAKKMLKDPDVTRRQAYEAAEENLRNCNFTPEEYRRACRELKEEMEM